MTPQHPPIYDDPDLFKIQPVFESDDDEGSEDAYDAEEFETAAYKSPSHGSPSHGSPELQEWSAKTETRFFPNLGLKNKTFIHSPKLSIASTTTTTTEQPQIETTPEVLDSSDPGMLLNLRPPSEFQSKTKKRNVEEEVVETKFRTHRQSRSSSGTSQPEVEEFETEFQKHSPPAPTKDNYEKYETPLTKVSFNFVIA